MRIGLFFFRDWRITNLLSLGFKIVDTRAIKSENKHTGIGIMFFSLFVFFGQ